MILFEDDRSRADERTSGLTLNYVVEATIVVVTLLLVAVTWLLFKMAAALEPHK